MSEAVIWKIIEHFPNYMISNFGDVKNIKTGRIKHISIGKRGYNVVSLRNNGKTYLRTVHRLVAQAFIPNPDNLPEVNHKDGNKLNLSLTNLEWVTTRENNLHARKTGLHKSDGDKAVMQFDKCDNLLAVYKSVSEASRKTKVRRSTINAVLNNYVNSKGYKFKTAGGYKWRYVNE